MARTPRFVSWRGFLGFSLLLLSGILVYALGKKAPALVSSPEEKPIPRAILAPTQDAFLHHEFAEWTLTLPKDSSSFDALRASTAPLLSWVEQGTSTVVTIGLLSRVPLVFDKDADLWRARWPIPWNAPDGDYALRIDTTALPADLAVEQKSFRITSRAFKEVPAGFGVLTLEGLAPFNKFRAPNGEKRTSAMAEWADYMGADAVLVQGSESSGYSVKLSTSFPWQTRSEEGVTALAEACRERGISLGVYILSFMVGGRPEFSPNYEYGWYYKNGKPVYGLDMPTRRGISIRDPQRPGDIVKMLNRWAAVPGVSFVGLDYIRPVFGGNELVDDFVKEMPGVQPPPRWSKMSKIERMAWIAPGRFVSGPLKLSNPAKWSLSDQWFWYRAHRSAAVLQKIATDYAGRTPLWGFTLSWQKGWEHAQDPIMFRDAGLDIDGIMLYEADGDQFKNLVNHWRSYAKQSQLNLVVGDTYDWRLHQKTRNPAGPEDFYNRMMLAATRFHEDKPVRGIFTHDLVRALAGPRQLGPYSNKEWFLAGGAAMTSVRRANHVLPYDLRLDVPSDIRSGKALTATLGFGERSSSKTVRVELEHSSDLEVIPSFVELTPEKPSATLSLRWRPNAVSSARDNRAFLAARAVRPDLSRERAQILLRYLQGRPRGSLAEADDEEQYVGSPLSTEISTPQ